MKRYKYIFTDLDGTLYRIFPAPLNELYVESLSDFLCKKGYDGHNLANMVVSAFAVMKKNCNANEVIEHIFFDYLHSQTGFDGATWKKLLYEYYDTRYDYCANVSEKSQNMPKIMEFLHKKGYKIFLTTNPLYLEKALLKRLEWSQVPKEIFTDITCM